MLVTVLTASVQLSVNLNSDTVQQRPTAPISVQFDSMQNLVKQSKLACIQVLPQSLLESCFTRRVKKWYVLL